MFLHVHPHAASLPSGPPARWSAAQVLVMHTTSYSGWGTVHLTCVSGCACGAEHFIDAAVMERVSVAKMYQAGNVTQHAACRLRFEVVQKTSSGGHRFKLSSLTVRVEEEDTVETFVIENKF